MVLNMPPLNIQQKKIVGLKRMPFAELPPAPAAEARASAGVWCCKGLRDRRLYGNDNGSSDSSRPAGKPAPAELAEAVIVALLSSSSCRGGRRGGRGTMILLSGSTITLGSRRVLRSHRDFFFTRTSGPRYPPQFHRKKISQGGVSLLGGSQIKNPEEEEPPFKLLKLINFGGCSSGGWFFLRVLGLETTQQIHSPGGGSFLQSNTHNQF